ncbi:Uu.00g134240.m01.CDS01 [Anthostomella pinea]|uniref:Uu.00g134240.m01.CDS01 n=1 Tax=Anthostomella pinea TaxID=933095 RepID=A0AAI8VNZ7_9PEZI|nr:Uu.00g134240.m01.CDS01 [Anthostomella pinea]
MGSRLIQAFENGKHNPADSALLQRRLAVRKLQVSFSQTGEIGQEEMRLIKFSSADARSNGFLADLAIIKAQDCIRRNDLLSAHTALSRFRPLFASSLERAREGSVDTVRGMVYRLRGHFSESVKVLFKASGSASEALAQLSAAMMCEMGEHDMALAKFEGWQQLNSRPGSKAIVGIRLALADAHALETCGRSFGGKSGLPAKS